MKDVWRVDVRYIQYICCNDATDTCLSQPVLVSLSINNNNRVDTTQSLHSSNEKRTNHLVNCNDTAPYRNYNISLYGFIKIYFVLDLLLTSSYCWRWNDHINRADWGQNLGDNYSTKCMTALCCMWTQNPI